MGELPSHRVSTRLPTDPERAVIRADAGTSLVGLGCASVLFLGLPAIPLGILIAGLTGAIPGPIPLWGMVLLGAIFLLVGPICVALFVKYVGFERSRRSVAELDARDLTVQVIEVRDPVALEIGSASSMNPIMVLDLGAGKLLLLQGQLLLDEGIYLAAREDDGRTLEELFDGPSPAFAFPCSHFVLNRLPHSGTVLSIEIRGPYMPPEEADLDLPEDAPFRDSELFDGSLETLRDDLMRHAEARAATFVP